MDDDWGVPLMTQDTSIWVLRLSTTDPLRDANPSCIPPKIAYERISKHSLTWGMLHRYLQIIFGEGVRQCWEQLAIFLYSHGFFIQNLVPCIAFPPLNPNDGPDLDTTLCRSRCAMPKDPKTFISDTSFYRKGGIVMPASIRVSLYPIFYKYPK